MRRQRFSFADDRPKAPPRGCDHPGCAGAGEFRAPKSRALTDYYWFCLDHVRDYNKAWNYFAGMSMDEIMNVQAATATWNRPTWRMGQKGEGGHFSEINDDLGIFAANGFAFTSGPDKTRESFAESKVASKDERRALAILNLDAPVTVADIKAKYKELVKIYHPDVNGGDAGSEEKIKEINHAYSLLMARSAAAGRG